MRYYVALALVVCAGFAYSQTADDPEVARAKAGIEKLRELVKAGAVPRRQLEHAEAALADAQDAAYVRRTLYGPDLTEEQSDEMVAVAGRRLDRRKQDLAKAEQLVNEGVASQLSLGTFLEELDRARKEFDLAESRARLSHELGLMARREQSVQEHLEQAPEEEYKVVERFDGERLFTTRDFQRVEAAYAKEFSKPLPVSALGETAAHRALGFDHRGRVDVALNPDQREGVWLRQFLTENRIPFFAFRQAVRGKATGAHIHIGPMSARLQRGG